MWYISSVDFSNFCKDYGKRKSNILFSVNWKRYRGPITKASWLLIAVMADKIMEKDVDLKAVQQIGIDIYVSSRTLYCCKSCSNGRGVSLLDWPVRIVNADELWTHY